MEADFSGYATKAGLKCSDGRVIMPNAFKHMDGAQVPLVWQHGHQDPKNVLGHAVLEHREDGVYAYGYFNDTPSGASTKALVKHQDVNQLSIYANQLVEKGHRVIQGAIREVSLVLAGANPGALIDNINIAHSDGEVVQLDDEAVIYTGMSLEHEAGPDVDAGKPDEEDKEDDTEDTEDTEDKEDKEDNSSADDKKLSHTSDKTIGEIYEGLTEEQKNVLHFMVGAALEAANGEKEVKQSDIEKYMISEDGQAFLQTKGYKEMSHNVFEQEDDKVAAPVLSHSAIQGIVDDAQKTGSLKEAVEAYALKHGIDDIDVLFPEARALEGRPEWVKRRTEWVAGVLGGARKSPFSRIKTMSADLTYDDARAKGYIKGNVKKEEFFGVAKRSTTPQTIYKKQKLDRDDMVDITDFDVVAWLKSEMRVMLDEELARAILIGDGRDVAADEKISETHIRPIAKDDDFYTITVPVNLDDANSTPREVVDAVILSRRYYKGTGLPTFYTTESWIGSIMVLDDGDGKRLYRNLDEVAAEMRVSAIVPVEALESETDILGVLVNMNDYVVGADRGGVISMFDDFDIDYNQYKYLIETRVSGALVKAKSAMVIKKTADTEAAAVTPDWDGDTFTVTIPTVTGIIYVDATDDSVLAGGDIVLAAEEVLVVQAVADTGYVLSPSARTRWTFRNRTAA